jgi:hypothetical protein
MSTTLDAQFLKAVVLLTGFKPEKMRRCQAALLMIGFAGKDYSAADIPAELTDGSRHIAGAATGALVSIGLLNVIRREQSPDPKAKGRKLDILRLADIGKAKAWLRANGFKDEIPKAIKPAGQMDLLSEPAQPIIHPK